MVGGSKYRCLWKKGIYWLHSPPSSWPDDFWECGSSHLSFHCIITTVMILGASFMGVPHFPSFLFPFSLSYWHYFWIPIYIGFVTWIIRVHSNDTDLKGKIYDRIQDSYIIGSFLLPKGLRVRSTYLRKKCRVGARLVDMILPYASKWRSWFSSKDPGSLGKRHTPILCQGRSITAYCTDSRDIGILMNLVMLSTPQPALVWGSLRKRLVEQI